jgi:hypothetical protein
MPLTVALENSILNKIFRNTDWTQSATVYVSLHTADPGDTGTNECTGGSYARQLITLGTAATASTISNTAVITFAGMPAATVSHYGIWSAATTGTLWAYYSLTTSRTTVAGDSVSFAIGTLTTSIA